MDCQQKSDVGIYHHSSRFFFVVDIEETYLEKIYEINDYLHRHPQVGILQKVKTKNPEKIMYKILGYNFYNEENNSPLVIINYIWTIENKLTNIKAAFTNIFQFNGKHFKIATNPWANHVCADEIPMSDPEYSEINKYRYFAF